MAALANVSSAEVTSSHTMTEARQRAHVLPARELAWKALGHPCRLADHVQEFATRRFRLSPEREW